MFSENIVSNNHTGQMFKVDLGLCCSHMTKTCFLLTSLGQSKPSAIWLLSHTRGGSRISEKGVHCIKVVGGCSLY